MAFGPKSVLLSAVDSASRFAQSRAAAPADRLGDLTDREREILLHVADGMSSKEVARALDLQEKTVKHYMTNILKKPRVRIRVEAAVLARESLRT